MGSTLGAKYDLVLAQRIQILEYLRETFDTHALAYLEPACSENKNKPPDC